MTHASPAVPATPGPPRIAPGMFRELGPAGWLIGKAGARAAGTRTANIMTVLGKNRRLIIPWLIYSASLMPLGKLARRETELVILRVAHIRGCDYEFSHHVRIGARSGVHAADVAALVGDPDAPEAPFSQRERILLRTTTAVLANKNLNDEQWAALRAAASEAEAIELLMLIGQYDGLATTVLTLGIAVDAER